MNERGPAFMEIRKVLGRFFQTARDATPPAAVDSVFDSVPVQETPVDLNQPAEDLLGRILGFNKEQ
jgi:hypothetical protein